MDAVSVAVRRGVLVGEILLAIRQYQYWAIIMGREKIRHIGKIYNDEREIIM